MKRILWVCLLVLGFLLSSTMVYAADFYVVPVKGQVTSWDKKIPGATRFKLVLDGAAVLDKETGLVWDKSLCTTAADPGVCESTWLEACKYCYKLEVGGRMGWRLPTIEELASLVDKSVTTSAKLPEDHPFNYVRSSAYWSSTSSAFDNLTAWLVAFNDGHAFEDNKSLDLYYVWCVRGGYGHDGYPK